MLRVTETMLKRDQIYLAATQKDTAAALSLLEGLERFEVPRTLEVTAGMELMARRRRVMRHGQENPRVTDLPELVLEKLAESAVMVLVCSSSSSTSRWIRAEVDEFYRTHPRGPVIPVVLDGEPDPDQSRQAFEKPCFPENLKKADMDRWVDGRTTDWAETAPVAALAAILGVRVEQIIHHEGLQTRRMRRQRSLALGAMVAVLVVASGWTFRWPLHEGAKNKVAIYAGRGAPSVERWLESVDAVGRPAARADRTAQEPAGGGAAPAAPAPAALPEAPAPAPAVAPAKKEAGFLEASDPVAVQLAVNAWLDEAEKYIPDQLPQAERWIAKAMTGLESGDGLDFGNEFYRVHALSAVIAQRQRDSDRSRRELLVAMDHWISIPIQDLEKREEEGFNILSTIAPTQEWRDSATKLVGWLGSLPGDEVKVSQRAGRFIDLVEVHSFLAEPVEKWLAAAAPLIRPAPVDAVGTAAKFAMLRADLLRSRGDRDGAVAALEQAEGVLAGSATPGSNLHRALAAQFRYRKAACSGAAVAPSDLEKSLTEILEGQSVPGWEGWFGDDLRAGWERLGDLHLRQEAFAESIGAYNRALEFSKNPQELAGILLKSGCAYRYRGDPAGAWDAFSLAIPIFEESKDDASLLTALWGGVLAARDLKRTREGAELQQRASQLQNKLGTTYQPPDYWRDRIGEVEFAPEPVAAAEGKKQSSPEAKGGPDVAATALVATTKDPAATPAPTAATPAPTAPQAASQPPEKVDTAKPAAAAAPESAGDLEDRIVTVQRKIAQLEADTRNRQTFRGLEELQNLYAELDSLLRRKLTGKPR